MGVINSDAFDAACNEWCYLKYELTALEGVNGFACPSCDGNQHTAHCDGDAKLVRCKSGGRLEEFTYVVWESSSIHTFIPLFVQIYGERDHFQHKALCYCSK